MYQYSNRIELPKSVGFSSFIKDLAFDLKLSLEIEIEESGFFIFKREKIRFRVESKAKTLVDLFKLKVEDAVEDYIQQINNIANKN